ncbi:uncharacterized protein LOC144624551 [Crassostrea virginica]
MMYAVVLLVFCSWLALLCPSLQAYENLALHKQAWQSSSLRSYTGADRAVDGQYTDLREWTGQCAVSDGEQTTEWRVDLGGVKNIHHVFVQYATENDVWENLALHKQAWQSSSLRSYTGADRAVDGQYIDLREWTGQCAVSDGEQTTEWRVDLGGVKNIHHVFVQYATENDVWGCNIYTYGSDCIHCGNCSGGVQCNHVTGTCPNGCDAGIYGDKCDLECGNNTYGVECKEKCECSNNTYGVECKEMCALTEIHEKLRLTNTSVDFKNYIRQSHIQLDPCTSISPFHSCMDDG